MSSMYIEASATIPASPKRLYDLLSDYRTEHPAILPKPYFTGLDVVQGGRGAGTVFDAHMSVMGSQNTLHMTVTEPEPGRVLMEEDTERGTVTTFTIDPLDDGSQAYLTIATRYYPTGLLERVIIRPFLNRVYKAELEKIASYVQHAAQPVGDLTE